MNNIPKNKLDSEMLCFVSFYIDAFRRNGLIIMNKILSFYKREPVNNGRQLNVDILKAVSVLFMVMCHAVIFLTYDEENPFFYFADEYLGAFLGGAPAFMICMGLGIAYSSKNDPKSLFIRGLKFFILSFVFNFFIFGIPALIYHDEFLYYLLSVDIFQFVGLALMAVALIKKLKFPSYLTLIIAVGLSSITPLFYGIEAGNLTIDSLINLFVSTTEDYAGFNFCSWFIFVIIGKWLGDTIKRVHNLDKFYLILMIITFIIAVIFNIVYSINPGTDLDFYGMHFFYALGYASSSIFLLSCFHFLSKVLPKKIKNLCKISAQNMTVIYIIHWLVLGPLSFHMLYDTENGITVLQAYIFSVILWIASYLLAIVYNKLISVVMPKFID